MTEHSDVALICSSCGEKYTFTRSEQEFYESKGFKPPSRCKPCRQAAAKCPEPLVCITCGKKIKAGTEVCCSSCRELDHELATKKYESEARETSEQLENYRAQVKELTESLRESEKLVAKLELELKNSNQKINSLTHKMGGLSQELEKAHQNEAMISWLQSTLNDVARSLENLVSGQGVMNQRILELARRVYERYDKINLVDVIRNSLKQYKSQNT